MEWEGTRSPLEKDAYGRVAISEADASLLHSLFDEAAMHAVDIFRPFLLSVVNSDEALSLNLNLSDSLPEEMIQSLREATENLLSVSVLGQWMEIVCPDRTAKLAARGEDADSKVLAILYHHPAPVRRKQ